MKSLGILWSSMADFEEQALLDLKEKAGVEKIIRLDLNDLYEDFVRDIYAQDDIAEWKVDKKIETMNVCNSAKNVTVVLLEVPTTTTYYHPFKKRSVYQEMEDLKISIRKKYSKMVSLYFFDNVFHMTDDEDEYKNDLIVVNNYLDKINDRNKKQNKCMKKKLDCVKDE